MSDPLTQPRAPRGPRGPRLFLSYLWAFLPMLSIGMLAPLPIIHAAVKLRRRFLWLAAAVYTAAVIVAFSATPSDDNAELPDWVGAIYFGLILIPTAHALALRRRVFAAPPAAPDPAVAEVLHARQRREEARALAAKDPALARELGIGRPDLPRRFDDGGLVDVNSAPAPVLAERLGLSAPDADRLVEGRDRVGGFSSAEEVIAFTDLSPAAVDRVRERLLFLR